MALTSMLGNIVCLLFSRRNEVENLLEKGPINPGCPSIYKIHILYDDVRLPRPVGLSSVQDALCLHLNNSKSLKINLS